MPPNESLARVVSHAIGKREEIEVVPKVEEIDPEPDIHTPAREKHPRAMFKPPFNVDVAVEVPEIEPTLKGSVLVAM